MSASLPVTPTSLPSPRRLTYLHSWKAADFIQAHGGPAMIWASHGRYDVFWLMGTHPDALDWDAGGSPYLAIGAHDGSVVAVTDAGIGYNGTGPSRAEQLLLVLGVDEAVARQIAYRKVSVVDLAAPAMALHTDEWPHFNLPMPQTRETGRGSVLQVRYTGEQVLNPGASTLRSWVDLLNSPGRPEWLAGPRRIELHTTFEACEEHGLVSAEDQQKAHGWVNPMLITQGQVQTWLTWQMNPAEYLPRGEVGRLSDVARGALRLFGVPNEKVARLDTASGYWDMITHRVMNLPRQGSYQFTVEV